MALGSFDGARGSRPALVLTIGFAVLLLGASSVGASEVVDLRIGAHPDFTRVVFELDRPTGYRIERATTDAGVQELVVSLDATSIPRKVHSQKSLIGLVRITPEGGGSVARIELSNDGLSLKEMILANPPRIVLDVLKPVSERVAAQKKKPAPKPVAKAAPKPAPQAKPAPAPKPVAKAPAPVAPKPVAQASPPPQPVAQATPAPKALPKPVARSEARPTPTPKALPPPSPVASATPSTPPVDADGNTWQPSGEVVRTRAEVAVIEEPSEGGLATIGQEMEGDPDAPSPAQRLARTASPAEGQPEVAEGSGIGMRTVVMAVVAVVLIAGGIVVVRRRQGAADAELDEGEEVDSPLADEGASDNPFSGLASGSGQSSFSVPSPTDTVAVGSELQLDGPSEDDEKPAAPVDGPLAGEGLSALGEAEAETVLEGVEGAAAGAATIGLAGQSEGDEQVMQMLREFEKRIASLEGRLEEQADARERLERQVAAQTEELRVQRAAIARTQRAVRNMNRPEEEGPTEPALRDPQ